MGGSIHGGHPMGPTGTFGWGFKRDAFASMFAGIIIGLLKRRKEFTKKEDLRLDIDKKTFFCYKIVNFDF
jgi:hypothetical protein